MLIRPQLALEIPADLYHKLGQPPSVDLWFIDYDLMIAAGRAVKVQDRKLRPRNRPLFLRRGTFETTFSFEAGRRVLIVMGCAHHHYSEPTSWK